MADTAREYDNLTPAALTEALARLDHELAQGYARLAEHHAQRQEALRGLKSARGVASDLSWELADLEQHLRDLQDQREGPGDALLEREIASVAARRAALEEQVLAQMLLVDELVARTNAEEQALNAEEREWTTRAAEMTAERFTIIETINRSSPRSGSE
jgi:hypothetical protein